MQFIRTPPAVLPPPLGRPPFFMLYYKKRKGGGGMLCEVRSLGLSGIAGYEVKAECDLSAGLPAFEVVGLPDAAVKEARDRVRAAIRNCGFPFPVSRITVNRTAPLWGSCPCPAPCGRWRACCPWPWPPGRRG